MRRVTNQHQGASWYVSPTLGALTVRKGQWHARVWQCNQAEPVRGGTDGAPGTHSLIGTPANRLRRRLLANELISRQTAKLTSGFGACSLFFKLAKRSDELPSRIEENKQQRITDKVTKNWEKKQAVNDCTRKGTYSPKGRQDTPKLNKPALAVTFRVDRDASLLRPGVNKKSKKSVELTDTRLEFQWLKGPGFFFHYVTATALAATVCQWRTVWGFRQYDAEVGLLFVCCSVQTVLLKLCSVFDISDAASPWTKRHGGGQSGKIIDLISVLSVVFARVLRLSKS